jgi:hypothetical protein
MKTDLSSTTIDQYTRQKWASVFIHSLRKDKVKILDVGGYKGITSLFSPDDEVIICDLFDVDEPNYVKGDGRKLPFKDNEFDFVVSFDTYEHVPREGRERFVSELVRVAKEGVILAAPFDNEEGTVHLAEVSLNDYHKNLYKGKEHPWLQEHIDYKIPKRSEIESLLKKLRVEHASLASNDITLWTLFQTIYFSIGLDDDLRGRVDDINRFYNNNFELIDSGDDDSSYRRIYFFGGNSKNIQQIGELIKARTDNHSSVKKLEFTTLALSVFGQKYRDVELYKDYLQNEIERLKNEVKSLSEKNLALTTENKALLEKPVPSPLHKRIFSKLK